MHTYYSKCRLRETVVVGLWRWAEERGRRRTLRRLCKQRSRQSTDKGHTGQRTSCVPLQCTHTTASIFYILHSHPCDKAAEIASGCNRRRRRRLRQWQRAGNGLDDTRLQNQLVHNCWSYWGKCGWGWGDGARRQLLYTCMIYARGCFQPTDNDDDSARSARCASQAGCHARWIHLTCTNTQMQLGGNG